MSTPRVEVLNFTSYFLLVTDVVPKHFKSVNCLTVWNVGLPRTTTTPMTSLMYSK